MDKLVRDIAEKSASPIFKNPEALRTDSIPEQILYREEEINKIMTSIFTPPVRGHPGNHLVVTGPPGTGKTLCTLYLKSATVEVLAKEERTDVRFVYVNCSRRSSPVRVMESINKEVKTATKKIEKDLDAQLTAFFEHIDKKYKNVIIILDEVDSILPKNTTQSDSLFYSLLRARELREIENVWITLLLISNDPEANKRLSPGTQSSLGFNWKFFKAYTEEELYGILLDRARRALKEGVYSEKLLKDIAHYVKETGMSGDARRSLNLLKYAAEIAERENATELTLAHFEQSKVEYEAKQNQIALDDMSWHGQMAIFVLVKGFVLYPDKKTLTIKQIYRGYYALCEKAKKSPVTEKQIRNYYHDFSKSGWVDEYTEKGQYYYSLNTLKEGVTLTLKFLQDKFDKQVERAIKSDKAE